MFATLAAQPVRIRTGGQWEPPAAWMPTKPGVGYRFELAPGIWIVRERQWWPVSVLDTGALIPVPDVQPRRRVLPTVSWHAFAACRAHPDANRLFFGVDDDTVVLPPSIIREARALCASCPVARECLLWALTSEHEQADGFVALGERFGIWAGTTGASRARMQRRISAGADAVAVAEEWLAILAGES